MAYAGRVWTDAARIPQASVHPVRRWLAARNLWWTGFPLPAAVRFLDRLPAAGWPYQGNSPHASAVVVLMATLDA